MENGDGTRLDGQAALERDAVEVQESLDTAQDRCVAWGQDCRGVGRIRDTWVLLRASGKLAALVKTCATAVSTLALVSRRTTHQSRMAQRDKSSRIPPADAADRIRMAVAQCLYADTAERMCLQRI